MTACHDDHVGAPERRALPRLLVLLVSVVVGRLALDGSYRAFLRPGMRPFLLASSAVLLGIVLVDAVLRRADEGEGPHAHARPGVYLLLPIVVALLVAPRPLGAYAVDRSVSIPSPSSPFPALDTTSGAVEMTLLEFNQRARDRGGETLFGAPIRLTGFVMAGSELRIARFRVACCAADGQAAVVQLESVGDPRPNNDRWVSVDGRFDRMDDGTPVLRVDQLRLITEPPDPYEPG